MATDMDRSPSIAESDSEFSSLPDSTLHNSRLPEKSDQGSVRSRATKFSRPSKTTSLQPQFSRTESVVKEKELKTKSIFQWDEGGKNVYITGSWDSFKEKLSMESIRPGSYRIVLPIPANERVEYFFYVDGHRRVASNSPSIVNEFDHHVNVKHGEATLSEKAGRVNKIISKISGLDLYSPFQNQKVASMMLFRFFYIVTFPAGAYYFYWLIAIGGNKEEPFIWLTYVVAEFMSISSAIIGLFSMWSPIRRKYVVSYPHPSYLFMHCSATQPTYTI